jgi:cysteine desulfurase / selenocysteine lyase
VTQQLATALQMPFGRDIKADFPVLSRKVASGKDLVYLDSAATSQKPLAVIKAVDAFYSLHNANVHRGVHTLAEEATRAYEEAREKIARFLGVPGPQPESCIVFTKNASEAVNLVAYSWGLTNLREGDRIVVTLMEHHSNIVPWFLVAERTGARVEFVSITPDGYLDLDDFEKKLSLPTKVFACTHASNVLGTVNPVEKLVPRAKEAGALTLIDGAQAAPHMPVDISAIGCDFYVATGHKMLGPTGIGILYGRRDLLEEMPPFLGGGEMISDVTTEGARWAPVPHKFEAGTPPIAQVIGLGAAVDYLTNLGMERVRQHEIGLVGAALEALSEAYGSGITLYGPSDPASRGAAVSFTFYDIHPHDIATILDQEGVAVRAGHHCAKPLMYHLGVQATTRASFYIYNDESDIDALVKALGVAKGLFGVA